MLRRFLVGSQEQEVPQRQAVGTTPSDAALTIDPLEVADEQHPEVPSWRNRAAPTRGIKGLTKILNKRIESGFVKQCVQLVVKDVLRNRRHRAGGDPQFTLPLLRASFHSHGERSSVIDGILNSDAPG